MTIWNCNIHWSQLCFSWRFQIQFKKKIHYFYLPSISTFFLTDKARMRLNLGAAFFCLDMENLMQTHYVTKNSYSIFTDHIFNPSIYFFGELAQYSNKSIYFCVSRKTWSLCWKWLISLATLNNFHKLLTFKLTNTLHKSITTTQCNQYHVSNDATCNLKNGFPKNSATLYNKQSLIHVT